MKTPAEQQRVQEVSVRIDPEDNMHVSLGENGGFLGIQCDEEGTPYAYVVSGGRFQLLGLHPDSNTIFNAAGVTGVEQAVVFSWFLSDSSVVLLLNGIENAKPELRLGTEAETGKSVTISTVTGDRRHYLASFSKDGSFQETIKLPDESSSTRLVPLPSGNLIGLVSDAQHSPRVALLNRRGQLLRYLDFNNNEAAEDEADEAPRPTEKDPAPLAQFVIWERYRDSVILFRPTVDSLLFKIDDTGEVQKLKLNVPSGFRLTGFVPSNRRLLIKASRNVDMNDVHTFMHNELDNNHVLLEFDPDTGKALRSFRLTGSISGQLACECRDRFVVVHEDEHNGNVVFYKGSIN
jgi:hypothetical protein